MLWGAACWLAGRGRALGAWGAAQATAAGVSIALGGALRDAVNALALSGALGEAMSTASAGYTFVYHLEIGLLFVTLSALGPLVKTGIALRTAPLGTNPGKIGPTKIGLADFPT